jgi:hypothetical protein
MTAFPFFKYFGLILSCRVLYVFDTSGGPSGGPDFKNLDKWDWV